MIFSTRTRIEEFIIEALDTGPMSGSALLDIITEQKGTVTKQAIYKSLRKLIKEEVINQQGLRYSLNRVWLQKIRDFTSRHIDKPNLNEAGGILNFEDGDSVVYTFKNPFLLDITWGHLYDIIYDSIPEKQIMLNYHPHEWLILSRPETEKFWLSRFSKDKKMMCFSIGGSTFLDRKFQKEYSSEFIKINLDENYGLKQNQYLSIQGDYIFEITTDEKFEKKVHALFEKIDNIDDLDQKNIIELSKLKYRSKLKLSKNKKKADVWRSKFKKDFYIPAPYYL